jgi:hypothetical protein
MAAAPADVQSTSTASHTAPGARLVRSMAFDAWRQLGGRIAIDHDAGRWLLGDWVAHGRAHYGRFYREAALVATRLDHETLRHHAAVARRFGPARRRQDLTFRHHAEVCAIADDRVQDEWLARAAAGRWSWKELHRRLRAADGTPPPSSAESVVVAADPEQAERWRRAASRSRCALDEWIAAALDRAAGTPAFGH